MRKRPHSKAKSSGDKHNGVSGNAAISMNDIHRMNHAVDTEENYRMQQMASFQDRGQMIVAIYCLGFLFVLLLVGYLWLISKNPSDLTDLEKSIFELIHHLIKTSKISQDYTFIHHSWVPKNFNGDNLGVRKIISVYPAPITRKLLNSIEYSKMRPQWLNLFSILYNVVWFIAPSGSGYLIPTTNDVGIENNEFHLNLRFFLERMVKVHKHVIDMNRKNDLNDSDKQTILEYHDRDSLRSYVSQYGQSCFHSTSQQPDEESSIQNSLRRLKSYNVPLSWETDDRKDIVELELEFNLWCMIHTNYAQGYVDLSNIVFPETSKKSSSPFQMSNNNMIIYDSVPSLQLESFQEKNVDVNERPSLLLLKDNFSIGLMTRNILDVLLSQKKEIKTEKAVSWKSVGETIATIIHGSDEQNGIDKWNTMYPICDKEMVIDQSKEMIALVKFCPSMKDVACCDVFFRN